jgi:hypothetical protein
LAVGDFFGFVPTGFRDNLEFRVRLRELCARDERARRVIWEACRLDPLFWLQAFCFFYEPRPRFSADGSALPKTIPAILWPHQVPVIKTICENLGIKDIAVQKSRGEGLSWIVCLLAIHDWLFHDMAKVGLVSSTELKADDPNNMDSLGAKCLAVDTPVLTDKGWRPIGDLRVGDKVVGSDGQFTDVVSVVPPYEAFRHNVTLHDGTVIKCTIDHKFPVLQKHERTSARRFYNPHTYKAFEVGQMRGSLRYHDEKHWNWQVMPSPVVQFPERDLPLDPYTVGALIGDGCLSKCAIELAGVDQEIADTVHARSGLSIKKWKGCSWGVSGPGLIATLQQIGLRGCRAWEKQIPPEYMLSSVEQRTWLLRGLMDTDGTISKNGRASFSTTSHVLAEQVVELVRSLGGLCSVREYTGRTVYKGENRTCRTGWKVELSIPGINPCHLARKRARYKPRKHTAGRMIVDVSPADCGMVTCITVANPDHLFLIDGNVLTHNCDWELARLPTWMVGVKDQDWKRSQSDHSWVNYRTGSQINAFAATADTGRAGRYGYFICDEIAFWDAGKDRKFLESIRESTECRVCVSTPNGSSGAFYDMCHVPSAETIKIRVHWTQNVYKNRGLYKIIEGRPEAVDPANNPIPPDYIGPTQDVQDLFSRLRAKGFRLEGRLRSPWYDRQCDRSDSTPQSIAQELDLDFSGAKYRVFSPDFIDRAKDTACRPVLQGSLEHNPETLDVQFSDRVDVGEMKLWVQLDGRGNPPLGTYVVAADIGSGLGGSFTSNSACEVFDRTTGEQVAEYASNTIEPSEFGEVCVAIARWFNQAYLGWESNFGGGFTKRVIALGYPNVYYRTVLWKRSKKKQKEVGWWTDDRTKELMFSDLHRKVKVGDIVLRSEDLVRECGEYVRLGPKSAIVHELSISTTDESSKGKAHGDRVIATCIAVQLMEDRPLLEKVLREVGHQGPAPPNTLAWRVEQWEQMERGGRDEWDDGLVRDALRGTFLD